MEQKSVPILMLKYRSPEIEEATVKSIVTNTHWPIRLLQRDNSEGPKNMAELWNDFLLHDLWRWEKFAVILDSDVIVHDGWLTKMMEVAMDEKRHVGVVVPKTNYCNESIQVKPPHDEPFAYAIGQVSGFCFLVNMDAYRDNGPFDEQFGFYGQDTDFFVRMAFTTDWAVMVQPQAFVEHLGHYSTRMVTDDCYDYAADKENAMRLFRAKAKTYGYNVP